MYGEGFPRGSRTRGIACTDEAFRPFSRPEVMMGVGVIPWVEGDVVRVGQFDVCCVLCKEGCGSTEVSEACNDKWSNQKCYTFCLLFYSADVKPKQSVRSGVCDLGTRLTSRPPDRPDSTRSSNCRVIEHTVGRLVDVLRSSRTPNALDWSSSVRMASLVQ